MIIVWLDIYAVLVFACCLQLFLKLSTAVFQAVNSCFSCCQQLFFLCLTYKKDCPTSCDDFLGRVLYRSYSYFTTRHSCRINVYYKKVYFMYFNISLFCKPSFISYLYSIHRVICRPSDHSMVRPRAEIRTRDGRIFSGRDTNH